MAPANFPSLEEQALRKHAIRLKLAKALIRQ
jgi:hypothetical protein